MVPLPATATGTGELMPPPVMERLPDLGPRVCGANRTYTGVDARDEVVYGILAIDPQVLLLADTSKSVLGEVIVMFPGNPVRLDPKILNVCEADAVRTVTPPKLFTVLASMLGFAGPPEHSNTGLAALRGLGAATEKSRLLLLVSVHPLLFLTAASVADTPVIGEFSEQVAVP